MAPNCTTSSSAGKQAISKENALEEADPMQSTVTSAQRYLKEKSKQNVIGGDRARAQRSTNLEGLSCTQPLCRIP